MGTFTAYFNIDLPLARQRLYCKAFAFCHRPATVLLNATMITLNSTIQQLSCRHTVKSLSYKNTVVELSDIDILDKYPLGGPLVQTAINTLSCFHSHISTIYYCCFRCVECNMNILLTAFSFDSCTITNTSPLLLENLWRDTKYEKQLQNLHFLLANIKLSI